MSDSPPQRATPVPAGSSPPQTPAGEDQLLARLRAATLGDYDIYGELGRGGMATVYLAHELALDRKVAIKVMSPALTFGPGMVERFKREARTAAQMSHPNIIPIYAVREAEGLLFFVMKLVEGTPLDSIIRELGKLPLPMIEAILAQVGGAFGYAHRRGVVHRDIKPSNILIDEEGWAVVTDFGIAKVQESEGLTQTGAAVGTPTYMSPEQCSGGTIAGASDQYSLGVVAYEMLTGKPPFEGSMMALMYSHFHEAIPPIEAVRPDCPEPLRKAVMRMLEKEPAARWSSMEEAIAGMGARQLSLDDPTRSQLILLARSSETHRIVSQVQTPRSPVPLMQRSKATLPAAAAPGPPRRRVVWLAGGGIAAAALSAFLLLRPHAAVPVSDAASIPPGAPAGTTAAPSPAPGGGAGVSASPPAAPPPPPVQRAGQQSGRQTAPPTGVTTGVPPRTESSTTLTVIPPAAPQPAPPPPPAPAPAPASVTPVQPPPARPETEAALAPPPGANRVVEDRNDVMAVLTAYSRALEAGDLAQARRIYPDMPADQRQGLEAFWKAGGTLQTRWQITEVQVNGDVATARVVGSNLVSTPRERPSEQRVALRARLERRAGGEWRLVALVN